MIAGISKGDVEGRDVAIPQIILGQRSPKVAIICGMHGDELSPFLVIEQLTKLNLQKGSLHLFPGVNQAALAAGKRFIDKDLNRVFPGRKDGVLEERIATALLEELQNKDVVIDLHCFELDSPVTAIQFKEKDDLVEAFNPELVWMLNSGKPNDAKFGRALGPLLTEMGIENFAVEMNSLEHFTQKQRVVEGLQNVLKAVGLLKGEVKESSSQPKVQRIEVRSDSSGIVVPRKGLLERVEEGNLLAEIIPLDAKERIPILAPHTGIIMQIARQQTVRTGSLVCSIGK